MRSTGIVAVLAFGGLACGTAAADWSGKGTFGGVLARGNTETETINVNVDVENKLDRWTHKAGASLLRTVTDDITSADRWELRGDSQYSLTERSYLVRALRYEDGIDLS
jgi:putative salt-induced outer membrane protein